MKVQFIKHSCFIVETSSATLIFDYSRGDIPELRHEFPIYVFVSHAHSDHFNPAIAEIMESYQNVTFIMASDIPQSDRDNMKKQAAADRQFIFMEADEQIEFAELTVSTLKSTDEGVAFIIKTGQKQIYFAGDLHWWTWIGENEDAEEQMKQAFMHEMDKIRGEVFDLAFLVLDPRQEDRYWWGFDYFMKNTRTKHAFPMHSWGKYQLAEQLLASECSNEYRDAVMPVRQPGEIFYVE